MYLNNWGQKDFKKFQEKFSKLLNVLKANKVTKIQTEKKKIRIGFLSPDFYKSHSISYFIKNLIKDLKQTYSNYKTNATS